MKALSAHVVPVTGVDESGFVAKALVDDVVWLDCTKVVLKTDNEPAILQLLQELLWDLRIDGLDQVMYENWPEHGPQFNGNAEVRAKLVNAMVRTMCPSQQQKSGFGVSARHPFIA